MRKKSKTPVKRKRKVVTSFGTAVRERRETEKTPGPNAYKVDGARRARFHMGRKLDDRSG